MAQQTIDPLRILQVNTFDRLGGAANVAWGLFQTYRSLGHRSWLAVAHRLEGDPDVLAIPNEGTLGQWGHVWRRVQSRLESDPPPAVGRLAGIAGALADPIRAVEYQRGVEDFRFPATRQLLKLPPERPDIVHCHNLHGGYFDLRALPWLSAEVPVVLTLHDAWLLSGHCAHSFACERWKTGCGHCPDLTIEPAVRRDATAQNWRRKRAIYERSGLRIATPSQWLMRKVEASMLSVAVLEARVIPNGVDLSVFHPAVRAGARADLGIPQAAKVVLFAGYAVGRNRWKDDRTMREAVQIVAERLSGEDVLLIALGDDAPSGRIGSAEVRAVPYERDQRTVARYFQAADVYAHASLADTFPTTVLEALACGTPVVATAVGGIPEQVEDGRTGFLVDEGDAPSLAARLVHVLSDETLRRALTSQAAEAAVTRFDLSRQAERYLDWYAEMLVGRSGSAARPGGVLAG